MFNIILTDESGKTLRTLFTTNDMVAAGRVTAIILTAIKSADKRCKKLRLVDNSPQVVAQSLAVVPQSSALQAPAVVPQPASQLVAVVPQPAPPAAPPPAAPGWSPDPRDRRWRESYIDYQARLAALDAAAPVAPVAALPPAEPSAAELGWTAEGGYPSLPAPVAAPASQPPAAAPPLGLTPLGSPLSEKAAAQKLSDDRAEAFARAEAVECAPPEDAPGTTEGGETIVDNPSAS
jgi:hypothetical protein